MAEYFQDENELKPSISSSLLTCPLCSSKRKSFTCDLCVGNGNFGHSNGKYSERYAEKLRKLEILKRLKKEYEKRALDVLKTREETEKLNCEVISSRQKVLLLRLVVQEAAQDLKSGKDGFLLSATQAVGELHESNNTVHLKQTEHLEKLQTKAKQLQQYQTDVGKSKKDLQKVMENLCKARRISISQIQKYLFPIQVNPVLQVLGTPPSKDDVDISKDIQCDIESDNDDENRESQLAEATRTSYIEGRWVSEEEDARMEYCINDAYLPGNGNYSSYHEWVKTHRNGSKGPASDEEISVKNPAFMMSAALTHTCQMVELIAFYLDVNLPKKINYSEFCHHELSKKDFKSAVDRLNANVLHLCFTQHVEPLLLYPRRTLHNLYTCLNSLHLGRGGPFECHPELISISNENDDSDASDQTDLASEEANSESDAEWENLPTNLVLTTDTSTHQGSLSQSMSTEGVQRPDEPATAASLVSSAAASVAALWPWKK
ncbi:beclin 1-associated autophagy-related key regulator-like isoform X1 [Oculina patagonica]